MQLKQYKGLLSVLIFHIQLLILLIQAPHHDEFKKKRMSFLERLIDIKPQKIDLEQKVN